MTNEVEKFDPSTLMQGVKDRIKATFVSLIPEDKWETLVKTEVDNFFKSKDTGYSNRTLASDFQLLVKNELNNYSISRLKEFLATEEFNKTWDQNGKVAASEGIRKMVVENSGAILTTFYGSLFQDFLQQFANNLKSRNY